MLVLLLRTHARPHYLRQLHNTTQLRRKHAHTQNTRTHTEHTHTPDTRTCFSSSTVMLPSPLRSSSQKLHQMAFWF